MQFDQLKRREFITLLGCGMVILTLIGKSASARLTPRGDWFARTLAAEMNVVR
jgi:hypothetical protein